MEEDFVASKKQKLQQTEKKLQEILTFLQDYLPLANVHSNDFILHTIWDKYLSAKIREELDVMSDEEVLGLPERMLQCQSDNSQHQRQQDSTGLLPPEETWTFSSGYLDKAPRFENRRKLHDVPIIPLDWKHDSVDTFLQDAARNTLPCSGLVISMEDLESQLRYGNDGTKPLVIPNFMTSKKSHEVNIMSDVCSLLAKQNGVDVTVDMGSGKGYLSTQLVYQHGLRVVGVDAQTINTAGASRRAVLLGKQWNALVSQAEELKEKGERKKKGKKLKKKMKQLNRTENDIDKKEKKTNREKNEPNRLDEITDEIFNDLQSLLDSDGISDFSNEKQKSLENTVNKKGLCNMTDEFDNKEKNNMNVLEKTCDQLTLIDNKETDTVRTEIKPCIGCNKYQNTLKLSNEMGQEENVLLQHQLANCKSKETHSKKEDLSKLYFPITTYVDNDMDIVDLVKQTGACLNPREATLMLTGLHTCGLLGSSLQNLFVNSNQTKILCYISCCYHLMNEEFVLAPFTDGHEDDMPGFPMSSMLGEHEVGLGRAARNFASQTIYRTESKLEAKSYPRSLLQKILQDTVGYIDDGWKGLRKLDQKCNSMYEYVKRAFVKLKLPTDKITTELVEKYVATYKDEERKLAVFLQLKSLLAPCIEAVILLDRYCYLLEQDCIKDALLVQMFDPVTSPRCHAIIAYKH